MKAEHYVKNIVLETKALYLTQLKVRMDTKGNVYNMHQLVFRDIKSVVVRDEILTHIATQAKIARDRMHASARLTNMVRPRWHLFISLDRMTEYLTIFNANIKLWFTRRSGRAGAKF